MFYRKNIQPFFSLSLLHEMVTHIETFASSKGIYRQAGSAKLINELIETIDKGEKPEYLEYNIHVVACAMKRYIQVLPEPLMTFELHDEFISVVSGSTEDQAANMAGVVAKMPEANLQVFRFLCSHLVRIHETDGNLMDVKNLSIVYGPTLFRDKDENPMKMLKDTPRMIACIQFILTNYEDVFGMNPEKGHNPDPSTFDANFRNMPNGKDKIDVHIPMVSSNGGDVHSQDDTDTNLGQSDTEGTETFTHDGRNQKKFILLKLKKTYTNFVYNLTTDPKILRILSDPEIFNTKEMQSLSKKLYKLSSLIGTTTIMLKELIQMKFEKYDGIFDVELFDRNDLLGSIMEHFVTTKGTKYTKRILRKTILFIIDTEHAKIVLNSKDLSINSKAQRENIIVRNQQKLSALVDLFAKSMYGDRALLRIPTEIKYVCHQIGTFAQGKDLSPFPFIDGLVVGKMFRPTIKDPVSRKIEPTSGNEISDEQNNILSLIDEIFKRISENKRFASSGKEMHMQCMNPTIDKNIELSRKFISKLGMTSDEIQKFEKKRDTVLNSFLKEDLIGSDIPAIEVVKVIYQVFLDHEDLISKKYGYEDVGYQTIMYVFPGSDRPVPSLDVFESDLLNPLNSEIDRSPPNWKGSESKQSFLSVPKTLLDLKEPLNSILQRLNESRKEMGYSGDLEFHRLSNLQIVYEKMLLKRELCEFDRIFEAENHHVPKKEDKELIRIIYTRYKTIRMIMATKGLSYPQHVMEKIAALSHIKDPLYKNPDESTTAVTPGSKKSRYSLSELSSDPEVIKTLKNHTEYKKVRNYKREVQKLLHQYQSYFENKHNRQVLSRIDREPMKRYYDIYRYLKHELVRLSNDVKMKIVTQRQS